MNITKARLKEIIKEEIEREMKEGTWMDREKYGERNRPSIEIMRLSHKAQELSRLLPALDQSLQEIGSRLVAAYEAAADMPEPDWLREYLQQSSSQMPATNGRTLERGLKKPY